MANKVFVSYARPDVEYAIKLVKELRNVGLDVWIDEDSLLPGQIWEDEIQKAIRNSDYFIALLSSNSINRRGYVQKELNYALDVFQEIPRGNVFLIPARLDNCQIEDIRLQKIHWVNLFPDWKYGIEKIIKAFGIVLQKSIIPNIKVSPTIKLRSEPIDNLSYDEVEKMFKERDFFDIKKNKQGKGLNHQYKVIEKEGEKLLVIDYTTGLTWQQSGSPNFMTYNEGKEYIKQLNDNRFAGYDDWRLPTLEEAMSLMETEKKNGSLYIDEVLDQTQAWIWTADKESNSAAWVVYFDYGSCLNLHVDDVNFYVRAVR